MRITALCVAYLAGLLALVSRRPPVQDERVTCRRIVSLVPSATELLFAAGAGDRVVGVTTWCTYPPEARTREKIGDISVNFERVAALAPDLVVSVRSMAGEATGALERMGFRVETVDAESFEEIAQRLRRLGRLTGHEMEGDAAARAMIERVRRVEEAVRGKLQPTVFFEATAEPLWSGGPGSYAGDAIRRAGGRNIMTDMDRPWGPVSWEVVLERDPDVILIAHDGLERAQRRAGWAWLKAVKTGRVHVVPRDAFYYPTPRLVEGLEFAARVFHEKN